MTHGSYASYTRGACRCVDCRRANTQQQQQYQNGKRKARGTISTAHLTVDTPEPERRVTGISGMTGSTVNNASGVRVWCRCGNSGYANKWLVGKSRKIDHCVECA